LSIGSNFADRNLFDDIIDSLVCRRFVSHFNCGLWIVDCGLWIVD
jgi:hypothetical protein